MCAREGLLHSISLLERKGNRDGESASGKERKKKKRVGQSKIETQRGRRLWRERESDRQGARGQTSSRNCNPSLMSPLRAIRSPQRSYQALSASPPRPALQGVGLCSRHCGLSPLGIQTGRERERERERESRREGWIRREELQRDADIPLPSNSLSLALFLSVSPVSVFFLSLHRPGGLWVFSRGQG